VFRVRRSTDAIALQCFSSSRASRPTRATASSIERFQLCAKERRMQLRKRSVLVGKLYWSWVWLLRYLVPPAIVTVFLQVTGLI
jgi:hypothetical protein